MNTRAIAAKILANVIRDKHALSADLLQEKLPAQLTDRDRSLIKEYCYGVLRWYHRLKIIADLLVYKPIKVREQEIAALLLIGLYQLIYLNTPPHAAVSETVSAARILNKPWARGLINQALHQFLNRRELFLQKADATESGRFSHPQWLIEMLQAAWPEHWTSILDANNRMAPMFLRVNPLQNSLDQYRQRLAQQDIESALVDGLPYALRLVEPRPVDRLPGFQAGCCSVQDLASQHIAKWLDLRPKQRVLDACAAPGGKSGLILETMPDLLQLTAIDQDPVRLKRVKDNIQRLKLTTPVQLLAADALHAHVWWDGQLFERILLDAPCSGTGVIRRHPDIKILRGLTDISAYAERQLALLAGLWPLLQPGGRLLYTTCSILPQENEQVISRFCQAYSNAQPLPIAMASGIPQKIGHQLLPMPNAQDGFYYALLTKS